MTNYWCCMASLNSEGRQISWGGAVFNAVNTTERVIGKSRYVKKKTMKGFNIHF